MLTFVASVAFVLGIWIASFLWKHDAKVAAGKNRSVDGTYPYKRIANVLTPEAQLLLRKLEHEAGANRVVLVKVRMADLLTLPPKMRKSPFLQKLVGSKGLDFVVCNADDYRPLLAINLPAKLDGEADLVGEILAAASIPFIVLPKKKEFIPGELAKIMRESVRDIKSKRRNAKDL